MGGRICHTCARVCVRACVCAPGGVIGIVLVLGGVSMCQLHHQHLPVLGHSPQFRLHGLSNGCQHGLLHHIREQTSIRPDLRSCLRVSPGWGGACAPGDEDH